MDNDRRSGVSAKAALAAGGLLVVLAAGCSSDPDAPAAGADAGTTQREAGALADGGGKCYPTEPVDHARYDYKPPRIQAGSCTQADVDNIVAYAKANPKKGVNDLKAEVLAKFTQACHDCIFADDGPTWAPLVTRDGEVTTANGSGCIEMVSGKGEACGRAHRQWDQCLKEACAACDGPELKECGDVVQVAGGACKGAADAMATSCGAAEINGYLTACVGEYGFDAWIKRQCVTGS
jgi:hypothetical protein